MRIIPATPSNRYGVRADPGGAYRLSVKCRTIVTAAERLALASAVVLGSLGTAWVWATQPVTEADPPLISSAGESDAPSDAMAVRQESAEEAREEDDAISARFVRPVIRPWTSADLPQAGGLSGRPVSRLSVRLQDRLSPARSASYGRGDYLGIIAREAASAGVPRELVQAVMTVESGFDPTAIGADGEIGLMQLMPATARMLGFSGSLAELADPEINIAYGTAYLAEAWRLGKHDICTATMKYRAGHGETQFSFLSVEYCVRVRAELAALGFPVTGSIPPATFGRAAVAASGGRTTFGRSAVQFDLKQLNAQLRQMTDRVVLREK